jgi:plastocyanin
VSAAGSASVSILDGNSQSAFRFSPSSITVGVGETVIWTNNGDAPHTVTGDGLGSPTLNNGQSYSHKFTSPGTVSYICSIHPFMTGTVIVEGTSSGGGGSGSSGSTGATPPSDASGSGSSSESQAVTSPDAAGTSTQLPSTGMPVLPLLIGGGALFLAGSLLRRGTRAT